MSTYAMPKIATNSSNAKKRENTGPRIDKVDAAYVDKFVKEGAPPVRMLVIGPDGETQDMEFSPCVTKGGAIGWRGAASAVIDAGHGKRFKITFSIAGYVPKSKALGEAAGLAEAAGDDDDAGDDAEV